MADEGTKEELPRDLYKALMNGDEKEVIQLCKNIPEGPSTYSKQSDLELNLLEQLPETHLSQLARQNDAGNTILHEAATASRTLPAAREILKKAPQLLRMQNDYGETPLFQAAQYGKKMMFKFLADVVDKECLNEEDRKVFFQRKDEATILRIPSLLSTFASSHKLLLLQPIRWLPFKLLACNSSAFKSGCEYGFLHRLLFSCTASTNSKKKKDKTMERDDEEPQVKVCKPFSYIPDFVQSCWRLPLLEAVRKENTRQESATNLSRFLIRKDTSWKVTDPRWDRTFSNEKEGRYGLISTSSLGQENGENSPLWSLETHKPSFTEDIGPEDEEKEVASPQSYTTLMRTDETPLLLHVYNRGRSILHVAIKHPQIEIFELVVKKEMLARRLIRKTDNKTGYAAEKIQSPALQLQKELLLFERVKEISTTYFTNHLNQKKLILHNNTTEWLKRTSENCIIVAVLISTVAFAAAYTIPGGPNQDIGFPLLHEPFFLVFTLTDVLSLTFTLTSVVTFLSILTSSFQLQDFKHSFPQKLMLGFTFLILSVSMMMVAFSATIVLMIHNKERRTKNVLYLVAFLPVTIFVVSYSPVHLSLLETCRYPLKLLAKACPRCNCILLRSWITIKLLKHNNVQASTIKPPINLNPNALHWFDGSVCLVIFS
ncbi:hypothetical protein PVL29_012474 [Vitis rotundifolia]|uniref:PGG domain-containing protein n=1 Tax=Vitis rotundifolia TaxID=103349 RepID=A0AA38ZIQ5_VITRO|nr:hypothetical protein PVL29_012474 [Vitis rotundifolia]